MSQTRASKRSAESPTTDQQTGSTTPPTSRPRTDRVVVDVGGTLFTTSQSTLTASSSYFHMLFSGRWSSDESIFLDRDPQAFAVILCYMRNGDIDLSADSAALARRVLLDAEFLGVDGLLEEVKARAYRHLHDEWQCSDAEAATGFDEEHGDLRQAFRFGVLPARYFGPEPVEPAPPEPRVVQILPAPKGCKVKIRNSSEVTVLEARCLALVEHPKSNCNKLDVFVTHPDQFRDCLASEVYGGDTVWTEIMSDPDELHNIMQVPEDVNLVAHVWKDTNDHSKGVDKFPVRFLRTDVYGQIEPVDFVPAGDFVPASCLKLKAWSTYNNFEKFVSG